MPPAITGKPLSITTAGSTRKRHIMLTPQAVTPSTPEITPKKRERLTPRNTARSNLLEDGRRTPTYKSVRERRLGLKSRPGGLGEREMFWIGSDPGPGLALSGYFAATHGIRFGMRRPTLPARRSATPALK
jgi:hypothetical protein